MATFTTNVSDFSTLFNVVVTGENAPDFPTFAPLADGFNFFGDNTRTPAGEIGDSLQTAFHRTGMIGEGLGGFTAVAGAGGLDDSNWLVNALVVVYDEGQTKLVLSSTAGITINPIESDLEFTGIINGGKYRHDGATLTEEFDFSGTINVATGAVTATEIRFFSNEQVGESEFFTVSGWVTGSVTGTIDDEEGFVVTGGTVKSLMIDVNGESFEVAGLAGFDAKKIFPTDETLLDTAEEFEALFSQILSGNDVITGQTSQTLKGFAGNDTLIAGGGSTTFFGGKGDDLYDFNGYYGPDHTISGETDTVNGGGIDTVKSYDSYTLGEGLEKLILVADGDEGLSGTGNTSNNTITGTDGNDQLDGAGGADSLFGGLGGDDYYLDNIGDKVGIEAVARRDMFSDDWDEVYSQVTHTLLANYEALYLQGEGTNINGTGNVLDNEIDGNSGNNSLAGLGGDDDLEGYGGNDTMAGGDGDDDLSGGDGNDRLDGGAGDDELYGDNDNDVLLGLAGSDYLSGGEGNDSADGGADDDYLEGSNGDDTLLGGAGMDEIYAGSNNDSVVGGDGNDVLFAEGENDTVLGGAGADIIISGSGNDSASGGDGNDSMSGDDGMDTMDGGAGDDTMDGGFDGGEANDIMTGGAGNDLLYGGGGADNLSGGDGNDYINTGDNSFFNTVSGGAGNDSIDSYNDTDVVDGGAGIDTLTVYVVEGANVTLSATTEHLTFVGGLDGTGTGNALANILTSGAGANTLIGGLGNDTYNIQGNDAVTETTLAGGGIDLVQLTGEGVTFSMGDGIENLTVIGSEGLIVGNSLGNVLRSEEGNAVINGGEGNDTYHVQADDSWNIGEDSSGGGNDLVIVTLADNETFGLGDDIERLTLLHSGEGTITAYSNDDANLITGATTAGANNFIHGGGGNDTILGGIGNDTLHGGDGSMTGAEGGTDSLSGGAGDDTYLVGIQNLGGTIATFAALTGDKITDSAGNDTLKLIGAGEGLTLTLAALPAGIENLDASEATNIVLNIGGATGLAGNNRLIGSGQNDMLNGGAGNDTLDGGVGNDTLIGGAGNDYYVLGDDGNTATEALTGGTLDILELSVLAEEGALNVAGFANFEGLVINDNSMDGHGTLNGTAGANYLGSKGVDVHTLSGGLGNDTYAVHAIVDESLNPSYDQIIGENDSSGGGVDHVIATLQDTQTWNLGEGLEHLTVLHAGEGTIYANGNDAANSILGALGEDADNDIDGGGGNDTIVTGAGDDYIYGDAGNDSISTGAGDDYIGAFEGVDMVNGGLGNDSYGTTFKTGVAGAATAASLVATITDAGGTDTLEVFGSGGITSFTYAMTAIDNFVAEDFGSAIAAKITGSATANNISTGAGNDSVSAGAGDDFVYAGYGNDTVLGGDGNDTLHGGQGGTDSLDGGNGNDLYVDGGGAGDEGDVQTYVMAQVGDEIVSDEGSGGVDTLLFKVITNQFVGEGLFPVIDLENAEFVENAVWQGTGSIDMIGNGGDNALTAGAGNDYLDGGEGGNDTLVGGAGNDELYGGDNVQMGDFVYADGDDSLDGGAGNDGLDGGEGGSDALVGGLGDDDLYGGDRGRGAVYDEIDGWIDFIYADGGDTMDGGAGNDYLDGGEGGDDSLIGGIGDDELWGGEGGSDTLIGGDGHDALYGGEGLDMFDAGGGFLGDGSNSLDGGNGNDYLYGGEGGDDTLIGGAGDDIMDGGGMTATAEQPEVDPVWEFAPDGDDSMDGGAGNDSMFGGEGGSDTMLGGLGNDTMDGGISAAAGSTDTEVVEVLDGDDEMDGGAGNDSMYGGEGGDDLMGDAGNDALYGGEGIDNLSGGAGNDTLYGGNVADGDDDADQLDGGAGNDVYHGNFMDSIGEGEDGGGVDRVFLQGGLEEDYFILDSSIEHATVDGAGSLYGNESANALVAGDGNGFVYGGGGNDTLTGGDGADQFVLSGIGGGDLATITDFSKLDGDSIALTGEDFASILGDGIAPSEITNAATAVGTGEQFVYKFSTGELFYDADGTGATAQVLVAKFTGNKPIALTSDDISGWISPPM